MSLPSQSYDFDAAVLGGGSAGFAAARTTARAGLRTALVDGAREPGGLCILRGCMPSKRLLHSAEVLRQSRRGALWGLRIPEAGFDFAQVMALKDSIIREFAASRRDETAAAGFQFIHARARFTSPHTLLLDSGASLSAAHFIITTGSAVAPSPLPALDAAGYITSDEAVTLTRLPKSLLVLGGGPVGVELAQFFARFDVQVTLVQRDERLLSRMDAGLGQVVEAALRQDGVTVLTGARLLDARKTPSGKELVIEHQGRPLTLAAEEILFALGRVPRTAGLGLEDAGVRADAGRIVVNAHQQTTAPHIYAAGDCAGSRDAVHLALRQAAIAAHNIAFPLQRRTDSRAPALSVVFTEPQAAETGLSESDAREQGVACLAASQSFSNNGKAILMEAQEGFVKLVAEPSRGEILGGCCAGPHAGELIHEIVAALHARMTVHDLAAMPHYHPTLAELWTDPAEELAAQTGGLLAGR